MRSFAAVDEAMQLRGLEASTFARAPRFSTARPSMRGVDGLSAFGHLAAMFERRHAPLLSRRQFLARLAKSALVFAALIAGALGLGIAGYHWIGALPWTDALLNASMILTGMGPVDRMETTAAKLFASGYALFSGVVFLSSVGVLVAPVIHRLMHRFHLEEEAERS